MNNITIIKKTGTVYISSKIAEEFNKLNEKYELVPQNPLVKEVEEKAYYLFGNEEYLKKDDFNEIKGNLIKPKKNRNGIYTDVNIDVNSKSYVLTYHGNESKSHIELSYKGDKNDPQKFMIYKIKSDDFKDEFNDLNKELKHKLAPNMDSAIRKNIKVDATQYETPLKICIRYNTFFTNAKEIENILKKFLKKAKNISNINPKDCKILIT